MCAVRYSPASRNPASALFSSPPKYAITGARRTLYCSDSRRSTRSPFEFPETRNWWFRRWMLSAVGGKVGGLTDCCERSGGIGRFDEVWTRSVSRWDVAMDMFSDKGSFAGCCWWSASYKGYVVNGRVLLLRLQWSDHADQSRNQFLLDCSS